MLKNVHSGNQRRSGRDRRRLFDAYYLTKDESTVSLLKERRSQPEQRKGWRRVSQWGSVCVEQNPPKFLNR
jgi:hypothetical protein